MTHSNKPHLLKTENDLRPVIFFSDSYRGNYNIQSKLFIWTMFTAYYSEITRTAELIAIYLSFYLSLNDWSICESDKWEIQVINVPHTLYYAFRSEWHSPYRVEHASAWVWGGWSKDNCFAGLWILYLKCSGWEKWCCSFFQPYIDINWDKTLLPHSCTFSAHFRSSENCSDRCCVFYNKIVRLLKVELVLPLQKFNVQQKQISEIRIQEISCRHKFGRERDTKSIVLNRMKRVWGEKGSTF